MHGITLDRRMWDPQFEVLAARFSVLRYDCRGFGSSSLPTSEPYTHSGDLKALLAHLGIERTIVVGLSMGGQISLELATRYPAVVEKLILVDSTLIDFSFSQEWKNLRARVFGKEGARDVDAAREAWLNCGLFTPAFRQPAVSTQIKQMISEYSGWHFRRPDHFPYVGVSAQLGEIEVPTLVVVGEHDVPDFLAIANFLAANIPAAREVVLPGVGHMANMEDPKRFNDVVMTFLSS